jgi:hypothetical protein
MPTKPSSALPIKPKPIVFVLPAAPTAPPGLRRQSTRERIDCPGGRSAAARTAKAQDCRIPAPAHTAGDFLANI